MSHRVFTSRGTVRLGDAGGDGRIRLAALARHLQDVAYDDVEDAGIGRAGNWVVRRVDVDVVRLPKFGERVELETMCTGVGPRWAERVTHVRVPDEPALAGAGVTARALWVFVDRDGRPRALPPVFRELYPVPDDRTRISPKLHHPPPPASVSRAGWPVRAADFDLLGHMNNAAYWDPVDEELATCPGPPPRRAEIEYRGGVDPGETVVVAVDRSVGGWRDRPREVSEVALWLEVDGDVRASVKVWRGEG
ncbi:MAG: hypothetical protein JOZ99_14335 [Actinobacteria bacterium]|nr:hypothetical protein [Actinomycetota bacterium]